MADYPLSKFHFKVIWNGEEDKDLRFTEVSGLTKEIEPIEYRDGFSNETGSIKMPGREKYSNVTMKRGTFKGNASFYEWYDTIALNTVERRDVDIILQDQNHDPVVQWTLKNAWCMKIEATDLKADGNEVAIETMEVVHEGLSVDFQIDQPMATYYPPVSFHFKVAFQDLDEEDIDVRFQSVSGLKIDVQTESVKEGGEHRFEHMLPVRTKYSNLVLKRGLVTNSKLTEWIMDAFESLVIYPKDVLVQLLNRDHEPLMTWNVVQAWPLKWSTTDLNAKGSEILIETLELRYQYFTLE